METFIQKNQTGKNGEACSPNYREFKIKGYSGIFLSITKSTARSKQVIFNTSRPRNMRIFRLSFFGNVQACGYGEIWVCVSTLVVFSISMWIFRSMDSSIHGSKVECAIKAAWREVKFSTESIVKFVNSVVTEENEVEHGDKSKLIEVFDTINYQKFDAMITMKLLSSEFHSQNVMSSVDTSMEEIKPGVTKEGEFANGVKPKVSKNLDRLDYGAFEATTKVNDFLIKLSAMIVRCLIDIFMEAVKLVKTDKFDCPLWGHPHYQSFWDFSVYHNVNVTMKTGEFLPISSTKLCTFRSETSRKK